MNELERLINDLRKAALQEGIIWGENYASEERYREDELRTQQAK